MSLANIGPPALAGHAARTPKLLVVALAIALGTTACYPSGYYVENNYVETEYGPPPPRAEVVSMRPGPVHVWVPGYWYWTGERHVWHSGYWSVPPATGHVWVPSGWVQHSGRYRYVPGRWSSPTRVPHHRYAPARRQRPVHVTPHRNRPGDRPPPIRR